jgi:hypothetical protein
MIRKNGYRFSELVVLVEFEELKEESGNAGRSGLVHWRKRRTA